MRIIQISINANLFRVKYLKNRVITIFNFEVWPPPPLDPASHLHILCQYTIQEYSIKDLLGPGGGTHFDIKNSDDPVFVIFDRK